jgi:hypothetical protein
VSAADEADEADDVDDPVEVDDADAAEVLDPDLHAAPSTAARPVPPSTMSARRRLTMSWLGCVGSMAAITPRGPENDSQRSLRAC